VLKFIADSTDKHINAITIQRLAELLPKKQPGVPSPPGMGDTLEYHTGSQAKWYALETTPSADPIGLVENLDPGKTNTFKRASSMGIRP